jgi:hypothetical protein
MYPKLGGFVTLPQEALTFMPKHRQPGAENPSAPASYLMTGKSEKVPIVSVRLSLPPSVSRL